MSRTALADGSSVRFAPDRGHRSKRKVPASQVAIPLAVAAPVGLLGARGVGLAGALVIAGVTAVVTVIGLVIWRLTLPRLVSVTLSPTHVTYRRYGRKNSVERSAKTRAAVRMVVMQAGLQSPYLIASCDGDGFLLNTDTWSEDDLAQIAAALSVATVVPPEEPVPVKQVRDDFPGALPFHMARPNWTAIIALVVAVPIVVVAMWAFGWWAEDDVDYDATQREATASQAAELPAEDAAAQSSLVADAQSAFGPGTNWENDPLSTTACDSHDGSQRIVSAQSADGSSVVDGQDVRRDLIRLAEAAGMSTIVDGSAADGSYELMFQQPDSGAYLRVRGGDSDGMDVSITSGSACTAS